MKVPDEIAVALVTAACVLGLAVAFEEVVRINVSPLFSTAAPVYLFIVYLLTRPIARRFEHDALVWSLAVIAVAMLTLLAYVI